MSTNHSILIPASAERTVPYYVYEFAKTYLYAVHTMMLEQADFEVLQISARSEVNSYKPQHVSVSDEKGSRLYRVRDHAITATVRYLGHIFELALFRRQEGIHCFNGISALGQGACAKEADDLLSFIITQSMEVLVEYPGMGDGELYVRPIELPEDGLDSIYLPEKTHSYITLFIQALLTYHETKKPLRLLFSGKPGTGKTKIIRAIAQECKGKATFIFSTGMDRRVEQFFEFGEYFSPVVLCIDDIDLLSGSREEGVLLPKLGALLQELDGFRRKDFFLLATTNDKKLVDEAASRPGRFDLIIDVSRIDESQYLQLVQSKTHSSEIVEMFDNEILSLLTKRRVTGAFIANLVKHLELLQKFNGQKLNKEYLIQFLEDSFKGFYKSQPARENVIGFSAD